ncbi:MAG: VCBS repeat-containing protein, partial [Thermoanaerobaculia bacterium]|nr:VCBS repeat-containing protein [Thermoanaerobaculia bacterium]
MKKPFLFFPLFLLAGLANISVVMGQTTFGPQQIIVEPELKGVASVFAADLDNDGDLDVLSASAGDDKIAWYENDGIGNFGLQQVITTNADRAVSVFAADVDNDG